MSGIKTTHYLLNAKHSKLLSVHGNDKPSKDKKVQSADTVVKSSIAQAIHSDNTALYQTKVTRIKEAIDDANYQIDLDSLSMQVAFEFLAQGRIND